MAFIFSAVYLLFFLDGCPFVDNIFSSLEALMSLELQQDHLLTPNAETWSCGLVHGLCSSQPGILLRVVNEKEMMGHDN